MHGALCPGPQAGSLGQPETAVLAPTGYVVRDCLCCAMAGSLFRTGLEKL
jgi:hypothetical protein